MHKATEPDSIRHPCLSESSLLPPGEVFLFTWAALRKIEILRQYRREYLAHSHGKRTVPVSYTHGKRTVLASYISDELE